MTLAQISARAAQVQLDVLGAFHPGPDDRAPAGCGTLVLLGPAEPGFWPALTSSPEWRDGAPDPVDRWSRRVGDALAADLGAGALYPFGAQPPLPFFSWALRTGRAWASPVAFLVHDRAGLMLSIRLALALDARLALPPTGQRPCETCSGQPCLDACPAGALGGHGYDVPACHTWLDTAPGQDCLAGGCLVRRACPLSKSWGRDAAQSAHYMRAFHKG